MRPLCTAFLFYGGITYVRSRKSKKRSIRTSKKR